MKDKNIPIMEIEQQSKQIDKILLKRNTKSRESKRSGMDKSADGNVFDLTKVDGQKKNADINSGSDSDPEVLSESDLLFPNYLVGEDGNMIHGLNLNMD